MENDNHAVNNFADAMKAKMKLSRANGRYGWVNPNVCTMSDLNSMFHSAVKKGDTVDIANFAMMIFLRGGKVETE